MEGQLAPFQKLMENKLFLQYLSGLGGAMSAGEPIGPALNQITQQNISSQNFMKLLQKMMGDAASPDTPSKVSFDGTKLKYETDMSMAGKDILNPQSEGPRNKLGGRATNTALAAEGSKLPGGSGIDWGSVLNPSSSAAINSADLAGLTPEMISQALRLKMYGEELDQRKISDYADMLYKSALINKALRPEKETAAIENYEYYVKQQKALGQAPKAFDVWDKDTRTGHEKDYERYKSEGGDLDFHRWLRDITALSGGLDLGEYKARREADADIAAQKYFTDPKGLVADVDKYVASKEVKRDLIQYSDDPKQKEIETVRAKEKFIRGKIAASGGTIIDEKLDGRTFVFKVQWQDGSTSEVRYAN